MIVTREVNSVEEKTTGIENMTVEESEMYERIDRYLQLSKRHDPNHKKLDRIIGAASGILAALAFIAMGLFTDTFKSILPSLVLAAVMFAVAGYFWFAYGKEPFRQTVRLENIIKKDGLETVYNDLIDAVPVEDTNCCIGRRYMYKKGACLFRIADIKKVYMNTDTDLDSSHSYAVAEILDETGKLTCRIRELKGYPQRQKEQFEKIYKLVEEARRSSAEK